MIGISLKRGRVAPIAGSFLLKFLMPNIQVVQWGEEIVELTRFQQVLDTIAP